MAAVVPRAQALLMYHLSWIGFFTGLVGCYSDKIGLGLGTCVGSLIAQNYWRDPVYGWRRNLDIVWIQLLIWTHAWHVLRSDNSPVMLQYVVIQMLGALLYAASWQCQRRGVIWAATFAHGAVHLCANGSLLIYYLN